MPAYRAELIAESLWEFIDEDRSVQTRLGREDSEYLARSVPFYAANQPLADISEMRVVQGMDAGLYQKRNRWSVRCRWPASKSTSIH